MAYGIGDGPGPIEGWVDTWAHLSNVDEVGFENLKSV